MTLSGSFLKNNNQTHSTFLRPLFSALVALLRFACPGALAQLSHSTQFVLQYRAVTERNQTTRFIRNFFRQIEVFSQFALTSFCPCQESNECSVNHRAVIIR